VPAAVGALLVCHTIVRPPTEIRHVTEPESPPGWIPVNVSERALPLESKAVAERAGQLEHDGYGCQANDVLAATPRFG
jgi:hypothetical protein